MPQRHNDDGLSRRGLMTSLGEGKVRSFNNMIYFSLLYKRSDDVSNRVSNYSSTFFLTVRRYGVPAPFSYCRYRCRDVQIISFKENIIRQFDSRTDSRALRAKNCIVGIPQIQPSSYHYY